MKRKIVALVAGIGALAIVGMVAGLWWAANQAPDFYEAALASPVPPAVRHEAARKFAARTAELVEEIRYAREWEQEFTQPQVNAWLAEELPRQYGHRIPRGVSKPRVVFAEGLVRIGFQLTSSKFDGVVSLDLRPTVPEPNRLAIAVESLYAGLLPLAPGSFTDDVSKQLDRHGVEHEWQLENGIHVLYVTIVPDRGDRPVLEEIVVDDEKLRIAGHREQPTTLTMATPAKASRRL